MRGVLLGLIGLLYLVSIPWYRASGESSVLWLGLPEWVTVSLVCYAAVAILNAVAWLLTDIPDPDPDPAANADASRSDEDGAT